MCNSLHSLRMSHTWENITVETFLCVECVLSTVTAGEPAVAVLQSGAMCLLFLHGQVKSKIKGREWCLFYWQPHLAFQSGLTQYGQCCVIL